MLDDIVYESLNRSTILELIDNGPTTGDDYVFECFNESFILELPEGPPIVDGLPADILFTTNEKEPVVEMFLFTETSTPFVS